MNKNNNITIGMRFMVKDFTEEIKQSIIIELYKKLQHKWPLAQLFWKHNENYWKISELMDCIIHIHNLPDEAVKNFIALFPCSWNYSLYIDEFLTEEATWEVTCQAGETCIHPNLSWINLFTWDTTIK